MNKKHLLIALSLLLALWFTSIQLVPFVKNNMHQHSTHSVEKTSEEFDVQARIDGPPSTPPIPTPPPDEPKKS
jgi:hypothetical protein